MIAVRVARPVIALLSGLLFGIGLFVSGMSNPAKVQAFLDVFGAWDPSLGLVMAAALGVVVVEFHGARAIDRSFVGEPFHWPEPQPVDFPLLVGSVVFGVGWGIAGLCPGAALVGLGLGQLPAAVFVTAMLLGIALVGQMTDDRGQ
ncbi:MAG: YeeE/YedE family protein [Candidatus Accumulibacter sp.]|nr:YeeE/YedE family protein [Accumulibacter sp.]